MGVRSVPRGVVMNATRGCQDTVNFCGDQPCFETSQVILSIVGPTVLQEGLYGGVRWQAGPTPVDKVANDYTTPGNLPAPLG